MALQSLNAFLPWPGPTPNIAASNLTFSSTLLDASGEQAAAVFQIPFTGTIAKIGFATGTVTKGDTMKVGIYAVSATTGDPDTSTAYGGMVAGTVAVADGDDNVWKLCTLGTNCSATKGDLVAVVIEFNSFTATDSLNIQRFASTSLAEQGPAYSDNNTGGAWAKSGGWPCITLEYSGAVYYSIAGVLPAYAITARSYNTGAANDEGGNIFTIPFKCTCAGAYFCGGVVGGLTVKLYDTDGSTVLASTALDKDQQVATSNGIHYVQFASSITLTAASTYRITILAAGASSEVLYDTDIDTTAAMGGYPGGTNVFYTTRDGGGAWSNTATRRAWIGLLIDQLDDGASTGGGGVFIMSE